MAASRRTGVLAVHSIDHFGLIVPDLDEAQLFYLWGPDVPEGFVTNTEPAGA